MKTLYGRCVELESELEKNRVQSLILSKKARTRNMDGVQSRLEELEIQMTECLLELNFILAEYPI